MRIWHIGALPSPQGVDGANATIWQVAREQVLLGHQVSLLLDNNPGEAAVTFAEQADFKLIYAPPSSWRHDKVLQPLLRSEPPHVLHLHRAFAPKQAFMERKLVRNKVPSVVTPHGAIDFHRRRVRKNLYMRLVERSRLYAASAITVVAPQEEKVVRASVPKYRGIIRWVPNPVDTQGLEGYSWKANVDAKRLIYLGRFHVVHKGIDILVNIARILPHAEFHLYGTEDPKTKRLLERLKRQLPPNVYFHDPVFGAEKAQVLAGASLYIQASRWEGFPVSVAEAMYLGVPCALADTFYQAELFRQRDLGFVFSPNPKEAAICLSRVLTQPDRLRHWSGRARAYAQEHFSPRIAALSYLKLYEEILH